MTSLARAIIDWPSLTQLTDRTVNQGCGSALMLARLALRTLHVHSTSEWRNSVVRVHVSNGSNAKKWGQLGEIFTAISCWIFTRKRCHNSIVVVERTMDHRTRPRLIIRKENRRKKRAKTWSDLGTLSII